MKKEVKKKNRRGRTILLIAFTLLIFFVGILIGWILGMQSMANYLVTGLTTLVSSSDVKINMNLTFNETKMIDYMFEKIGNPNYNSTNFSKGYQLPCTDNDCIPRGQTEKNIYPQPTIK